jgi:hypothetical protein
MLVPERYGTVRVRTVRDGTAATRTVRYVYDPNGTVAPRWCITWSVNVKGTERDGAVNVKETERDGTRPNGTVRQTIKGAGGPLWYLVIIVVPLRIQNSGLLGTERPF